MPQAKRSEPVRVPYPFDEAIQKALRVKPPPGGWRASRKLRPVRKGTRGAKKK